MRTRYDKWSVRDIQRFNKERLQWRLKVKGGYVTTLRARSSCRSGPPHVTRDITRASTWTLAKWNDIMRSYPHVMQGFQVAAWEPIYPTDTRQARDKAARVAEYKQKVMSRVSDKVAEARYLHDVIKRKRREAKELLAKAREIKKSLERL